MYISTAGVAVAKATRRDDRCLLNLRADPIDRLTDAGPVLKTQCQAMGLKGSASNLVLAPELYSLTLIEKPPVADDELKDAVRWRMRENLEFPVEEATLDVFAMPESAVRDRPMVFVVAIQTESLKMLLEKVYAAGMGVASVDISELALRNLVHGLYPSADQGVGLLRMTSSSSVINISRGEELFLSRRVSGVPSKIDEISWEDVRERLLLQVQRSIDYYESAMSQPPCSALLVATTHGWQDRVCDYLNEMMPLPVRPLKDELRVLFDICLHNPHPVNLNWDHLASMHRNALAATLPALGGVLRNIPGWRESLKDVAA
ncbi:MAG: hypothetical protein O7G86_00520 [Gammaproteobacteria bacterium]|nr:hypothetical protein [Gammaproteobacteria bacterium]